MTTAIAVVMTETMVMMNEGNRGQCATVHWHESTVTTVTMAIAVVMTEAMATMNENYKEQCVRQSMGMDSKTTMAKAS